MNESRVVAMRYRPDIDDFHDMKKRIGSAAESVKSTCPVEVWLTQNDMMIHVELNVTMKEKQPGCLEPALMEFRSKAGDPRYILPFSDYNVVERVFPEKDLKRSIRSLWMGKYLVERRH